MLLFFGALQQWCHHVGNSFSRLMKEISDVDPISRRARSEAKTSTSRIAHNEIRRK
jgi:hypothetical protein